MLEIKQLTYVRGNKDLLRNITFSLKPGGLLWIAGANGSGKSTLLRLLVGILPWQAGSFYWRQGSAESRSSRRPDYLRQVIYLGHQLGLKLKLSALENLRAWLALRSDLEMEPHHERSRLALVQALMDLGLKKNQSQYLPVEQLSQGQKSRAALARLRAAPHAALWILDEPFAGLDPSGLTIMKDLCEQHLAAGGMIILTSPAATSHSTNTDSIPYSIKAASIQHLHLSPMTIRDIDTVNLNFNTVVNSVNFNTESCNV